ncbi:hypothetical protein LB503_010654 [Fusarium chuoi]|nr:hypothetical protein LB503_010654 [Fusarium chuoi]
MYRCLRTGARMRPRGMFLSEKAFVVIWDERLNSPGFHRYDELLRTTCKPFSQISAAGPEKSPDSVLTGLAQLATCQTKTERSFYIVAEATPSTSLLNNSSLHNSDEDLLLCGTYIARADGACHYALRAMEEIVDASSSQELPVIVVQDLAADPRFYAAVPIRSPRGINIGVLCVMNPTPGGNWTDKHSNVMRGLSQTIMDHLEGNRIKHSLKRSTAMSLGLQRFTERGNRISAQTFLQAKPQHNTTIRISPPQSLFHQRTRNINARILHPQIHFSSPPPSSKKLSLQITAPFSAETLETFI